MTATNPAPHSRRFDPATGLRTSSVPLPHARDSAGSDVAVPGSDLHSAISRTRTWLLERQHDDGYWVGELEGDTILESEYILLLTFLGREQTPPAAESAKYLLEQQLDSGGWSVYPGGPVEISASVKAWLALRITGHAAESEPLERARAAILRAGGVEQVNSFTRYYLALLGVIPYDKCPAVPPELILLPSWMPFNIYEMSAWSRTIIVPLTLLWAFRPSRELPDGCNIDELFVHSPDELRVTIETSDHVDPLRAKSRINWDVFFRCLDRCWKALEKTRFLPLRQIAIRKAERWVVDRFEASDGLGAIFPPIIWSIVALKCLGYDEASPEISQALDELEKLSITENGVRRLQPCRSPVWDTALTMLALREADVEWNQPAIRRGVDWLLSKEVRHPGDWSVRDSKTTPGGWFFEFDNRYYPDVDDTAMVLMALRRCLPATAGATWQAELLERGWSPHPSDAEASAVVSARNQTADDAVQNLERVVPTIKAMARGFRWVLAMQSSDGGWGAFDVDNVRELFTRVPFADHNAMIDPGTADITARVLEMFGTLNVPAAHPAAQRAIDFVWNNQESDHAWFGRWGVNYIYGTWQVLAGLSAIGVPIDDPRVRGAADWLKQHQQPDGSWGESAATYDHPQQRGSGHATASQTAWAVLGLMAAGEADCESVKQGISWLLTTQLDDGTWEEPWFTGTGFPRVFYLRYHYYRIYFPLIALARYARLARMS